MNILTVNLLFSTLVFGIAAKLYLIPKLLDFEPSSVVLPILLLCDILVLDVADFGQALPECRHTKSAGLR